MALVLRNLKGSELTWNEMDENFMYLENKIDAELIPITAPTGVVPGSYNVVTVNEQGKVISGSNPSSLADYGISDVYTKAQTDSRIQYIINVAPAALDTLHTIAIELTNTGSPASSVINSLSTKVDKIAGKGLSTNDFTTAEKNKLASLVNYTKPLNEAINYINGLQSALDSKANLATTYTKYAIDQLLNTKVNNLALSPVAFSGSYNDLINKPINVSTFNNDAGYITLDQVTSKIQNLIGNAPNTLNTIQELADKLTQNDATLNTINDVLATKAGNDFTTMNTLGETFTTPETNPTQTWDSYTPTANTQMISGDGTAYFPANSPGSYIQSLIPDVNTISPDYPLRIYLYDRNGNYNGLQVLVNGVPGTTMTNTVIDGKPYKVVEFTGGIPNLNNPITVKLLNNGNAVHYIDNIATDYYNTSTVPTALSALTNDVTGLTDALATKADNVVPLLNTMSEPFTTAETNPLQNWTSYSPTTGTTLIPGNGTVTYPANSVGSYIQRYLPNVYNVSPNYPLRIYLNNPLQNYTGLQTLLNGVAPTSTTTQTINGIPYKVLEYTTGINDYSQPLLLKILNNGTGSQTLDNIITDYYNPSTVPTVLNTLSDALANKVDAGTTLGSYGITDAQPLLVSGNNIKTINGQPILGNGNIVTTQTSVPGNAGTATKLATPITIATTGDVTAPATTFDGSSNVSLPLSLANSGVTAGNYGSATSIPSITVNPKGIVTSVSSNPITIPSGNIAVNSPDMTISGTTGTTPITNAALTNTGVTPGTYKSVTVDPKGRVTAASNPSTLAGYGINDAYDKVAIGDFLSQVYKKVNDVAGIDVRAVGYLQGGYKDNVKVSVIQQYNTLTESSANLADSGVATSYLPGFSAKDWGYYTFGTSTYSFRKFMYSTRVSSDIGATTSYKPSISFFNSGLSDKIYTSDGAGLFAKLSTSNDTWIQTLTGQWASASGGARQQLNNKVAGFVFGDTTSIRTYTFSNDTLINPSMSLTANQYTAGLNNKDGSKGYIIGLTPSKQTKLTYSDGTLLSSSTVSLFTYNFGETHCLTGENSGYAMAGYNDTTGKYGSTQHGLVQKFSWVTEATTTMPDLIQPQSSGEMMQGY